MSKEVAAPNFEGRTVDGKPWPEKPKKAPRKNTKPARAAEVEEDT